LPSPVATESAPPAEPVSPPSFASDAKIGGRRDAIIVISVMGLLLGLGAAGTIVFWLGRHRCRGQGITLSRSRAGEITEPRDVVGRAPSSVTRREIMPDLESAKVGETRLFRRDMQLPPRTPDRLPTGVMACSLVLCCAWGASACCFALTHACPTCKPCHYTSCFDCPHQYVLLLGSTLLWPALALMQLSYAFTSWHRRAVPTRSERPTSSIACRHPSRRAVSRHADYRWQPWPQRRHCPP
jgi:hypothetical protein